MVAHTSVPSPSCSCHAEHVELLCPEHPKASAPQGHLLLTWVDLGSTSMGEVQAGSHLCQHASSWPWRGWEEGTHPCRAFLRSARAHRHRGDREGESGLSFLSTFPALRVHTGREGAHSGLGDLVANRVPTHGLSRVIASKEVPGEKEGTLSKDKDKHRSRHQNTWGVLFF